MILMTFIVTNEGSHPPRDYGEDVNRVIKRQTKVIDKNTGYDKQNVPGQNQYNSL